LPAKGSLALGSFVPGRFNAAFETPLVVRRDALVRWLHHAWLKVLLFKLGEARVHWPLKLSQRWVAGALAAAIAVNSSLAAESPAIDLAETMSLTVDGLLASQLPDGLFPYGFDFRADKPLEPERMSPLNLIRQAGTASALVQYYRHTGDVRLVDPIQQAITAFGRRSLPIGKTRMQYWVEQTRILSLPFGRWKLRSLLDRLGLLYQPAGEGKVVSPDGSYKGALAGTVALSLVTELTYAEATGDNRFEGLRSAWLQGLMSLHIPGGGFRKDPVTIDDSDFYNGEGWLALAVYCDLHRDDAQAAATLADLDRAMMERYSRNFSRPFHHWGAMAAAQRHSTTRDPRFLAFLKNQTYQFFDRSDEFLGPDSNHCGDMEGLAATLAAMNLSGDGKTALAWQVRGWLAKEVSRLPALQIRTGQVEMALNDGTVLQAPRMAEFPGAFLWTLNKPSIRVDAAQHCLSAMTMLERDRLLVEWQ
jgi:hypothetical protein